MTKTKIKKTVKRRATVLVIGFFLAFIFLVVTSLSYVYEIRALRKEEEKLTNKLENLQTEEKKLSSEIVKLKDPNYIAKYAREKFFYTKAGEYVIKIENKNDNIDVEKKDDIKVYYIVGAGLISLGLIVVIIYLKGKNKKH